MEVTLNSFVTGEHSPADYVFPQSHDCYEIILYSKGYGKTTIGSESYDFFSNTIAMITPGTQHDEYSSTTTEVFCCLFSYKGDLEFSNGLYVMETPLQLEYVSQIQSIFWEIRNEMRSKRSGFNYYLNFLMGQLLILFFRTQTPSRPHSHETNYAKSYIRENYSRKFDFHILSEQIGYSYDRFRHVFKERTGKSPAQYLLSVRIKKAKELLRNTNYSIKYIGKLTCLGDTSRFVETFKSQTGITPLRYRNLSKEIPEHVYFLNNSRDNDETVKDKDALSDDT